MGWLNIIDGILIILLSATIFCAVSLSRRLSSLRSDKKNLEKLMSEFHHISEKADKSLTGIRATAEEVSRELAEANAKSRSMRDELAFLVERADRLAEKIATKSNDLSVGKEANDKHLDNEQPNNEQLDDSAGMANNIDFKDSGQSQVERELLSALRRVK
jgi:septal ring factor EnvC (AmiA/AmiB activator)|tara:strand:+ start:1201 stop:1680 length:480 start_codon:yes stop_codon:yes gene_type:complete